MKETIEVITRFQSPIMTADEYVNFSQRILSHLQKFNPMFETINSWGDKPSSWTKIDSDFSNFKSVVLKHIFDEEINYKNPDNQKGFFPYSISWAGFSNSYSNTKKAQDGKFSIAIGAGDENGTGFINIKLPQTGHDDFYQIQTVKSLILHILEVVPLTTAYVVTDELFDRVVDFDKPYDVQIGWLNYFNKQNICNYLNDIEYESINEKCFFWLSAKIETPTESIVAQAIKIRDYLGEQGYLN